MEWLLFVVYSKMQEEKNNLKKELLSEKKFYLMV